MGGVPMLQVTPSSVPLTTFPGTAQYGTNAQNVYAPTLGYQLPGAVVALPGPGLPQPVIGNDSGIFLTEGRGFGKWSFQLLGTGTGYTIYILGTLSPVIGYTLNNMIQNPQTPSNLYGNRTTIPATDWFILPSPSEQSGTGSSVNPLVAGTSVYFESNSRVMAVRAVLSASTTPTGSVTVVGMAIP